MSDAATLPPSAMGRSSRWRPRPGQALRLLVGLVTFGVGEALIVRAALGNSPWTVLAQGAGEQLDVGVGVMTIAVSALVLALWIPLRQSPGLGTIANAIVIGAAIDLALPVLPDLDAVLLRGALLIAGIALVGIGSGLYLGSRLGPGPRDGLMTALHRRTGVSLRAVRSGLELTALASGVLLGGTAGVGTLAFALAVGPAVQASLHLMGETATHEL